jgi:hypothetical protein
LPSRKWSSEGREGMGGDVGADGGVEAVVVDVVVVDPAGAAAGIAGAVGVGAAALRRRGRGPLREGLGAT